MVPKASACRCRLGRRARYPAGVLFRWRVPHAWFRVWGMELGGYFQALAAGMSIIAQCTGTAADLVALGARSNHADDLIRLHRIYYGPTTNTQRQRLSLIHISEPTRPY